MLNKAMMEWASGIHMIDRSEDLSESDPLYAFALDELLCKEAATSGNSYCHIWRHPQAFIVGQRDSRLPSASDAINDLNEQGFATAVRNSGGAAVPLDLGVVNLSIILSNAASNNAHFHQDFEKMYTLIQEALSFTGVPIHKGEIQGAFCPGDYDLSINGQKFCGIAQRRQVKAYSIQAFIIVSGSGIKRTQLVKDFYQIAAQTAPLHSYPQVHNGSTASLEELAVLGDDAVHQFVAAIKQTLAPYELKASEKFHSLLPEPAIVREFAAKLRTRYEGK